MYSSLRRRRDADDADEEADVFEGGTGFNDDDDDQSADTHVTTENLTTSSSAQPETEIAAIKTGTGEAIIVAEDAEASPANKRVDQYQTPENQEEEEKEDKNQKKRVSIEDETSGHPTYVPRNNRYFFHEYRHAEQGGSETPSNSEPGAKALEGLLNRFRADELSIGHSADHERRRELVDTDQTRVECSNSKWPHDRFNLLNTDQPLREHGFGEFGNGFPQYRRGRGAGSGQRGFRRGFRGNRYRGRGFKQERPREEKPDEYGPKSDEVEFRGPKPSPCQPRGGFRKTFDGDRNEGSYRGGGRGGSGFPRDPDRFNRSNYQKNGYNYNEHDDGRIQQLDCLDPRGPSGKRGKRRGGLGGFYRAGVVGGFRDIEVGR